MVRSSGIPSTIDAALERVNVAKGVGPWDGAYVFCFLEGGVVVVEEVALPVVVGASAILILILDLFEDIRTSIPPFSSKY